MITRWNLSKTSAPVECGVLGWLALCGLAGARGARKERHEPIKRIH